MHLLLRCIAILTGFCWPILALAGCVQGPSETVNVKACTQKDAKWQHAASWYERAEWVTLVLADGSHADYRAYAILYYEDGWEEEQAIAFLARLNPCDSIRIDQPMILRRQRTCCDKAGYEKECEQSRRVWLEPLRLKSVHPPKRSKPR